MSISREEHERLTQLLEEIDCQIASLESSCPDMVERVQLRVELSRQWYVTYRRLQGHEE